MRDLRRRASGREHNYHEKERSLDGALPASHESAQTSYQDIFEPKRDGFKSPLLLSKAASSSPSSLSSSLPTSPTSSDFIETSHADVGPLSRHPSYRSTDSGDRIVSPSSVPQLRLQVEHPISRDSSMKKFRDRVRGTRPGYLLGRAYLDERHGVMGEPRNGGGGLLRPPTREGSESDSEGMVTSLSRQSSLNKTRAKHDGRLVAVKVTPRKPSGSLTTRSAKEEEERTRVGFVRELEVLKVSKQYIAGESLTISTLAYLTSQYHATARSSINPWSPYSCLALSSRRRSSWLGE